MATNVKPGDLAVLIGCDPSTPENLGAIVEVVRASGRCPCGCMGDAAFWHVRATGRLLKGFVSDIHSTFARDTDAPDAWLRPIKGLSDDAVDEVLLRVGEPARDGVSA